MFVARCPLALRFPCYLVRGRAFIPSPPSPSSAALVVRGTRDVAPSSPRTISFPPITVTTQGVVVSTRRGLIWVGDIEEDEWSEIPTTATVVELNDDESEKTSAGEKDWPVTRAALVKATSNKMESTFSSLRTIEGMPTTSPTEHLLAISPIHSYSVAPFLALPRSTPSATTISGASARFKRFLAISPPPVKTAGPIVPLSVSSPSASMKHMPFVRARVASSFLYRNLVLPNLSEPSISASSAPPTIVPASTVSLPAEDASEIANLTEELDTEDEEELVEVSLQDGADFDPVSCYEEDGDDFEVSEKGAEAFLSVTVSMSALSDFDGKPFDISGLTTSLSMPFVFMATVPTADVAEVIEAEEKKGHRRSKRKKAVKTMDETRIVAAPRTTLSFFPESPSLMKSLNADAAPFTPAQLTAKKLNSAAPAFTPGQPSVPSSTSTKTPKKSLSPEAMSFTPKEVIYTASPKSFTTNALGISDSPRPKPDPSPVLSRPSPSPKALDNRDVPRIRTTVYAPFNRSPSQAQSPSLAPRPQPNPSAALSRLSPSAKLPDNRDVPRIKTTVYPPFSRSPGQAPTPSIAAPRPQPPHPKWVAPGQGGFLDNRPMPFPEEAKPVIAAPRLKAVLARPPANPQRVAPPNHAPLVVPRPTFIRQGPPPPVFERSQGPSSPQYHGTPPPYAPAYASSPYPPPANPVVSRRDDYLHMPPPSAYDHHCHGRPEPPRHFDAGPSAYGPPAPRQAPPPPHHFRPGLTPPNGPLPHRQAPSPPHGYHHPAPHDPPPHAYKKAPSTFRSPPPRDPLALPPGHHWHHHDPQDFAPPRASPAIARGAAASAWAPNGAYTSSSSPAYSTLR